jgi:hypothetical protein
LSVPASALALGAASLEKTSLMSWLSGATWQALRQAAASAIVIRRKVCMVIPSSDSLVKHRQQRPKLERLAAAQPGINTGFRVSCGAPQGV